MPTKKCRNCGSLTNTAVCDWLHSRDELADGCFLKWVDGRWEEGCALATADPMRRRYAEKVLSEQVKPGGWPGT